jgi:hypothetical protein
MYLQKFISFAMVLPSDIGDQQKTPSILKYATHIAEEMGIPPEISKEICNQIEILSVVNTITVRDVGKIMSAATLLPAAATNRNIATAWKIVTATLLIFRVIRPDLLNKLANATVTEEELEKLFGATREKINRELEGGAYNSEYHHSTMLLFYCWKYICRNGASDGSSFWPDLGSLFGRFGSSHPPKAVPRAVLDDWLNLFRLS